MFVWLVFSTLSVSSEVYFDTICNDFNNSVLRPLTHLPHGLASSHAELVRTMTPTLVGKYTTEIFVRRSVDRTHQAWVSLRLLVVGVQMAIFEEREQEQVCTLVIAILVVELKFMVMIVIAVERLGVPSTSGVQGSLMDIALSSGFVYLIVSFGGFTGVFLILSPRHRGSEN